VQTGALAVHYCNLHDNQPFFLFLPRTGKSQYWGLNLYVFCEVVGRGTDTPAGSTAWLNNKIAWRAGRPRANERTGARDDSLDRGRKKAKYVADC
jgi:hypothetical protein